MTPKLQALLDKRPSFKKSTRRLVEDRARKADGCVECAHCAQPITEFEQVTLNHRNQWSSIKSRLVRDPLFLAMDTEQQWQKLCMLYNDVNNLEPLHVACHIEIDEGRKLSPDEAVRVNRKHSLTKDAEPIAPQKLVVKAQSLGLIDAARNIATVSTNELYTPLLETELLSAEQKKLLQEAPRTVRIDYLGLCRDRMDNIAEKIGRLEARGMKNNQYDKLITRQTLMQDQIDWLQQISQIRLATYKLPKYTR